MRFSPFVTAALHLPSGTHPALTQCPAARPLANMNLRLLLATALGAVASALAVAAPTDALTSAQSLAAAETPAQQAELGEAVALGLVRRGRYAEAEKLASTLPAYQHANVFLAVAEALPPTRRADAETLLLAVQTDRALTTDWHKSRIARGLAVAHARLGRLDVAEAMAREVPDTEDRAFALQGVVAALCHAGEVARARELAGSIEENRRYGTYRQKAEALAGVAAALHARGDTEGSATLLAQAGLLLPKKPGWSDGGALRAVAVAQHACGDVAAAEALLARTETLAQAIAGPWKVTELTQVAAAWRRCGQAARADRLLTEAGAFLVTLAPLDRAPEALVLARAQVAAGKSDAARAVLVAALADVATAGNAEVTRAPQIRALLTWAELFASEPLPAF